MRWRTFEIQREPGFRFNLIDLGLISALAAASAGWHAVFPEQHLYLLPLYVGVSFFLFCNVFRIGNKLEPWWYVTFVLLTAWGLLQPEFPWLPMLAVCETVKWALIAYRIRKGPYVGAFRPQLARFTVTRASG
jgi:hypothetical protein